MKHYWIKKKHFKTTVSGYAIKKSIMSHYWFHSLIDKIITLINIKAGYLVPVLCVIKEINMAQSL